MIELIKKHWITSLGIVFIFWAIIYFLKIAMENGWLPPVVRVVICLAVGISLLYAGYSYYNKSKKTTGEILAGLGVSILYATLTYISFSDALNWPFNVVFIAMLAITFTVAVVSYVFEMRALIFMSILGGLLSPILIKATPEHDLLLFAYVLILNLAAIYVSISKKWSELRVLSFAATGFVYLAYYIVFEPIAWGRPFFYVSMYFIVYTIGSAVAAWREKEKFQGLNLFVNLMNALIFGSWSIYILTSFDKPFIVPVLIIGVVFLCTALLIHTISGKEIRSSMAFFIIGFAFMAIASTNIQPFDTKGLHYAVSVGLWLITLMGAFFIGQYLKSEVIRLISLVFSGILLSVWFVLAWQVEWVPWFGLQYIPFINIGAFVWIGMAVFGFTISRILNKEDKAWSIVVALVSNIIVAALITIQLRNCWLAYDITSIKLGIVQSISYLFYALVLFLFGARNKLVIYRIVGSVALIITAGKVFFWDLQGEATYHKVLFLLILGATTLLIAYVNKQWSNKELDTKTDQLAYLGKK